MVVGGMLVGIIACIVPITIVVLIITAISKKNKEDKKVFEDIVRNIYVYIILITTLVAIIAGIIDTFRIGLDIILPEKSLYEKSYNSDLMERNENIVEFSTAFSIVISVIPIFIYHNNVAKKNRENKQEENK